MQPPPAVQQAADPAATADQVAPPPAGRRGGRPSRILFAAVIAVPALAWWRFGLTATVAFWAAYVVTRPLGASFADWFAKPRSGRSSGAAHGVGYGDGTVTVLLTLIIAVLVEYLAVTRTDVQRQAKPVPLDATSGG